MCSFFTAEHLLPQTPLPACIPPLARQVTAASPSFEEVALRLMETGEPQAVAAFLQARLDTLGREDKAQVRLASCDTGCWVACAGGQGSLDTLGREDKAQARARPAAACMKAYGLLEGTVCRCFGHNLRPTTQ